MDKMEREKVDGKIQQSEKDLEVKTKDKKQVKDEKDYPYYVILNDVWGTSSKQQVKVPVRRWIDGSNVYLYNEKSSFKEEMPEDTDEYKEYKIEELTKKIFLTEEKIKAKNSNNSIKDLQQDLRIYKSWLKSLQLQGRGSYMNLDLDGKPFFEFDRKGMFRMPVFKNIDYSLKYVPDESKIKEASDLIMENNKANGDNDNSLKYLTIAMALILGLMIAWLGYLTYNSNILTSELGQNLVEITNSVANIGINLNDNTNDLLNLTSQINNTQPVTPKIEVPVKVIGN